jgi:hypothetical protein
VPAKLREAWAAPAPDVAMTLRMTTIRQMNINLFKQLVPCITCDKPTISTQQMFMRPLSSATGRKCFQAPLGLCEINFVDLKPDEFFHPAALSSDRGVSDAQESVEHRFGS